MLRDILPGFQLLVQKEMDISEVLCHEIILKNTFKIIG